MATSTVTFCGPFTKYPTGVAEDVLEQLEKHWPVGSLPVVSVHDLPITFWLCVSCPLHYHSKRRLFSIFYDLP
eukprot:jgi/Botrbrau1/1353/Bobra.0063s0064.1